jgi:hypothetical protein
MPLTLFTLTPESMAARYPYLFRISRIAAPAATFAERHAAALAVVRQPLSPAACTLLATRTRAAGKALET